MARTQNTENAAKDRPVASTTNERDRKICHPRFSGFRLFWSVFSGSRFVPTSVPALEAQRRQKARHKWTNQRKERRKTVQHKVTRARGRSPTQNLITQCAHCTKENKAPLRYLWTRDSLAEGAELTVTRFDEFILFRGFLNLGYPFILLSFFLSLL